MENTIYVNQKDKKKYSFYNNFFRSKKYYYIMLAIFVLSFLLSPVISLIRYFPNTLNIDSLIETFNNMPILTLYFPKTNIALVPFVFLIIAFIGLILYKNILFRFYISILFLFTILMNFYHMSKSGWLVEKPKEFLIYSIVFAILLIILFILPSKLSKMRNPAYDKAKLDRKQARRRAKRDTRKK